MKDEEQMAGKHRTIRSLVYGLIASVCLSAILHAATSSTIVLTPNERLSAQSTKIADRSAYGTDWSLERCMRQQLAGDYIDGIYSSGTIAVVDFVRRSVIKKIPVKPFPFALAFDDKRRNLYVTHLLLHVMVLVLSV